jgi:hypothetical protein
LALRHNDAQGHIGVGNRIEEASAYIQMLTLPDVCHQRAHTAENEGFGTRFRAPYAPEVSALVSYN